jgi:hypothetical protein
MSRNEETFRPMSLSDVCEVFRIKKTTLEDYISAGVCQKVKHRFNNRGREMWVLMPDQVQRLERFLRYREWFVRKHNNDRPQVSELIGLLEAIDGGDLEGAIEVLTEVEETLDDKLNEIRSEREDLYAKLHREKSINEAELG